MCFNPGRSRTPLWQHPSWTVGLWKRVLSTLLRAQALSSHCPSPKWSMSWMGWPKGSCSWTRGTEWSNSIWRGIGRWRMWSESTATLQTAPRGWLRVRMLKVLEWSANSPRTFLLSSRRHLTRLDLVQMLLARRKWLRCWGCWRCRRISYSIFWHHLSHQQPHWKCSHNSESKWVLAPKGCPRSLQQRLQHWRSPRTRRRQRCQVPGWSASQGFVRSRKCLHSASGGSHRQPWWSCSGSAPGWSRPRLRTPTSSGFCPRRAHTWWSWARDHSVPTRTELTRSSRWWRGWRGQSSPHSRWILRARCTPRCWGSRCSWIHAGRWQTGCQPL